MSDLRSEAKDFLRTLRIFLAISGAIALIAGLVLLIWPAKSAIIVTGIIASYLIVGGLIYIGLGIFSGRGGGWARAGHILLGVLYIVTGVVAFANLAAATASLALIVAVFVGVSWIVDGLVALTLLSMSAAKVWTVLYAILGIVAGAMVLFSPLYAAVVLWIVLGASLVALGLAQIVRAVMLKRDAQDLEAAVQQGDLL